MVVPFSLLVIHIYYAVEPPRAIHFVIHKILLFFYLFPWTQPFRRQPDHFQWTGRRYSIFAGPVTGSSYPISRR
jgi:hypothetical protein